MFTYDDMSNEGYFLYTVFIGNYAFDFERGREDDYIPKESDRVGLYQVRFQRVPCSGDYAEVIYEDTDPVGIEDAEEASEEFLEGLEGITAKDIAAATRQAQTALEKFIEKTEE